MDGQCEFYDICKELHENDDVAKRRVELCSGIDSDSKKQRCAVYYAILDGYHGLDED